MKISFFNSAFIVQIKTYCCSNCASNSAYLPVLHLKQDTIYTKQTYQPRLLQKTLKIFVLIYLSCLKWVRVVTRLDSGVVSATEANV